MSKSKKTKYPGVLSRPMPSPPFHEPGLMGGLTSPQEAENKALWDQHWEDAMRRMELLREFYKAPPNAWLLLALRLAIDHVPGLRVAARSGRPIDWPPFRIVQLRYEMDKIIESRGPGFSVESAAKILIRRGEWKPKRPGRAPWEVLRRRYYEADLRWVAVLRDAEIFRAYVKEPGEPISSQEEMAPR